MNFGNKIKWIIKNRGLSQREVAAMIEVPESTLSRWTSMDYPDLKDIEAICKALDIPLYRFFSDVDLSVNEKELLRAFGKLSPDQQARLIEFLKSL